MKKLKLNLDELKVESFEISKVKSNIGTVIGQVTGKNCESEFGSCDYTCDLTCGQQSCVGVSYCPECPETQHYTCLYC